MPIGGRENPEGVPPRRLSLLRGLLVALGLLGLAAGGVGVAAALGASSRSSVDTTITTFGTTPSPLGLHGVVGPGFTISFTFSDGQPITALAPGLYSIKIEDLSDIHDFHLTGGGTDKTTGVPDIGSTQWMVDFTPGTYTFVCDPHAATMVGQISVLPYGTVTSFSAPAPAPVAAKHHRKKKH